MLIVRPIEASDPAIRPLADQVLCGESVTVRIARTGFSLAYTPAANAYWRVFPSDERASDVLLLPRERWTMLGAFLDERFVGAAIAEVTERGWLDILDIRVDASVRRSGVGQAMLGACQSFAVKHSLHGLHAAVRDDHPVMCQFLEHCGFQVQGLDRMACAMSEEERRKPLLNRTCLMHFYCVIDAK